jgi:multiple sugar transport system permease protein
MQDSGPRIGASRLFYYAIWALLIVVALFPIVWMVINSLKPTSQQLAVPPVIIPDWTLDSWGKLIQDGSFTKALLNTTIITVGSCILTLLLAIPAAYSFSRFRVGGPILILFIMVVRLMPPTSFMIPYFVIARQLGLYDTQLTLILVYTFFNLPIAIWFLLGYMSAVPREVEESALIDGCSYIQILRLMVVPMLAQPIAAVVVFLALQSWSEFPLALVLSSRNSQTIPILVNTFVSGQSIDFGAMCAAAVISTVPIVILGMITQRYMVQGLTAGAVKG